MSLIKILSTDKIAVTCVTCNSNFKRRYFDVKKSKNKYGNIYCIRCIAAFSKKKIGTRALDKINILCNRCNKKFIRTNFNIKKSFEKHGANYCCSCINCIINNKESVKNKHRKNGILRISGMTKGEKCKKYGNDYWKTNVKWLKEQKSKNGHRQQVIEAVAKMSKKERRIKYGRSGKNNGMYGKPSPKNSGIGYTGYYKKIFFRSLFELSYLSTVNINTIKGAEKSISIKYKYNGNERTYKPDFIIGDCVIEIKPKNFIDLDINKIKFEAARKWCFTNNCEFKVIHDIKYLSTIEIKNLLNRGDLVFTSKSFNRFVNRFGEI